MVLHLWIQPTADRIVLQYVFIVKKKKKKNPCVSGTAQFKPMLFKGQLNLSGILLYGRLISPLIQSYQYGRMDILHFELYSNTTLFVAQVIPALAQSVIL